MMMVYYRDVVVWTVKVVQVDILEVGRHDVGLGRMQDVDFW